MAKTWLQDMDPFVAEANELPDQLPPMYAADGANNSSVRSISGVQGESNTTSGSEDVYWSHRQGAVRLTREWRKLFRKCALTRSLNACKALLWNTQPRRKIF